MALLCNCEIELLCIFIWIFNHSVSEEFGYLEMQDECYKPERCRVSRSHVSTDLERPYLLFPSRLQWNLIDLCQGKWFMEERWKHQRLLQQQYACFSLEAGNLLSFLTSSPWLAAFFQHLTLMVTSCQVLWGWATESRRRWTESIKMAKLKFSTLYNFCSYFLHSLPASHDFPALWLPSSPI